jgi:hypothetical protein
MNKAIRVVPLAVIAALMAACHDTAPTAVNPLPGGTPLLVDLKTVTGVPASGLPRLTLSGGAGTLVAQWDVVSGFCMIVNATAQRAGSVIVIWFDRYGNPSANCVGGEEGYEYLATVKGLPSGVYQVQVVDQIGDNPGRQVGRATLAVAPAP